MVSAKQASDYRTANKQLTALIERDVRKLWSALGALSPEGKRDALLDYVPGLVDRYGQVAATVAAEYFEETTGASATFVDAISPDGIQSSVRYFAGGLWTGEGGKVLAGVTAAASRYALQYGRSTIHQSSLDTAGVSYARVPEPGACNWCLILSSRGAAYGSKKSAGGEGNDYHDECACQPVAVHDDSELPYDPEELYEKYDAALNADIEGAPTGGDVKAVAARMRVMYGGK